MKKKKGIWRTGIIVGTAIILTTISINAADNIGSFKDSLLGSVVSTDAPRCPSGMVLVPFGERDFCVDAYENSAGASCGYPNPANNEETRTNLTDTACTALSVPGAVPWRNIARHQAELACARAGKRLPTNKEWYRAALGTPDNPGGGCNIGKSGDSGPRLTGSGERCASSVRAFDMVGNVWEWVDGSVEGGQYAGRSVPASGYVSSIDEGGVALVTQGETPDPSFNDDYFWSDPTEVRGIIRGGYWGIDTDAGLYAVNAVLPPTFTGIGAGFRCVK
jgi:hypothetical protein